MQIDLDVRRGQHPVVTHRSWSPHTTALPTIAPRQHRLVCLFSQHYLRSSHQLTRLFVERFINRYHQGATDAIITRVEEVANKKGVSMAQVATAWVLSKPGVSAPIVGTTNLEHLKDILSTFLESCLMRVQKLTWAMCRCGELEVVRGGNQIFGGSVPAGEGPRPHVK